MRLAKFLAHAGLGSRRDMEVYITSGRVQVNGVTITACATTVDPEHDHVVLDGNPIAHNTSYEYIIVHKPSGYISTTEDTHNRKKVLDLLPESMKQKKWIIVGRLDKDSEGLILLTDHGELANRLMHPRYEKEKEYVVHFRGKVQHEVMQRLLEGVVIPVDDTSVTVRATRIDHVEVGEKRTKAHITLQDGKKRQIRLMGEAIGHRVTYLTRVRIGTICLGDLPLGAWRVLTPDEIQLLLKTAQL